MNVGLPAAGVYIADTSAFVRADQRSVTAAWRAAMEKGQLATCSVVRMELAYTTTDLEAMERMDVELAVLRDVRITASAQQAALAAMHELASRGPLHHRIAPIDLLIAAAAQEAGIGVLHYDRHFDRLAEVLGFESRWLIEPGGA